MAEIAPAPIQQSLASIPNSNQAIAHRLNVIAHEMNIEPQQLILNLNLSAQSDKPLFFRDLPDDEDHPDAI